MTTYICPECWTGNIEEFSEDVWACDQCTNWYWFKPNHLEEATE